MGTFNVSPAGDRVAVTRGGGTARLWDAQTRTIIASIPTTEMTGGQDVAFSAHGKVLISGGHDMKVQSCLLDDQHNLNLLLAAPPIVHSKQVVRVDLSHDGQHLAVALWPGRPGRSDKAPTDPDAAG